MYSGRRGISAVNNGCMMDICIDMSRIEKTFVSMLFLECTDNIINEKNEEKKCASPALGGGCV